MVTCPPFQRASALLPQAYVVKSKVRISSPALSVETANYLDWLPRNSSKMASSFSPWSAWVAAISFSRFP